MGRRNFSYIIVYIIGIVQLGLVMPGPVSAQSTGDETRLQSMRQQVEQEAAAKGQKAQAEILAKQFQVPVSEIEKLRNAKQGWGEITIRLALADQLVKTDPKAFPTVADALQRVGDLRSEGKGWGNIAKELGFKLGPVVSEVQRAQQEFRTEVRTGHPTAGAEARTAQAKDNQVERAQQVEQVERPQRPERPERPQRPERLDRIDRPGR